MNRKQEISKDLSLVIDGLLLGLCLWVCYLLRISGLIRLDGLPEIPPFSHSYWMLGLIIPVTPLLLDLHGFYDNPLTQRFEIFFQKMARAGFWLVLIIGLSSIFGKSSSITSSGENSPSIACSWEQPRISRDF